METLTEIEARFGVRLDLQTLLVNTLAQIAAQIDAAPPAGSAGAGARGSLIGRLFGKRR